MKPLLPILLLLASCGGSDSLADRAKADCSAPDACIDVVGLYCDCCPDPESIACGSPANVCDYADGLESLGATASTCLDVLDDYGNCDAFVAGGGCE